MDSKIQLSSAQVQGEQSSTRQSPLPNVSVAGRSPSPAPNLSQAKDVQSTHSHLIPAPSPQLTQFVKRSPSPAVNLLQPASTGRSPSPSIGAASFSSPSPSVTHGQFSSNEGPPPPKRKRLFHRELKYMMHGFGDDSNPYSETVDLVEELVVQFITEMTVKAMEVGKSGRVHVNDIIFIIRKDPKKYSRVKDLLMMKEQIDKAKKAFADDSEPVD